jgi:hypothetical protein
VDYLTFESIKEAYQKMAAISPQIMWRTDRDACLKMDARERRGYLIISPELDLGEMDVDGCIVSKDGIEYRVHIHDLLRGMKKKDAEGNETDEINPGYWVAPMPEFSTIIDINVMLKPSPKKIDLSLTIGEEKEIADA